MTLHPQSRAFVEAIAAAGKPAWQDMEIEEARKLFDALPFFGAVEDLPKVDDLSINSVPVRVYRPELDSRLDVIVYFHGGGWVLGGLESHDALCRRLAKHSGAAVVAVDYRRPPEDPFPAALDDCLAVCKALQSEQPVDDLSGKLVLAGDSAGGNLAAAVSLRARQDAIDLAGQVLIYPVLDGELSGATYSDFAEGFGLTRETMRWFWEQYAGDDGSAGRIHPSASPLHAVDYSGLPATHVLLAEYDVLRSEGEAFVSRLREAEIPTTVEVAQGMLHGFIHFAGQFDDALPATQQIAAKCREFLNVTPA